jgi:hypothetical protein
VFKAAPADIAPVVSEISDLVPLSHLGLDLPVPSEGWAVFLGRRGIQIVPDSLGRDAIGHDAAKRLFDEKRANELRRRALMQRVDEEAIERDREWRASLGVGVPVSAIPAGSTYGEAVAAAELDAASGGYRVGARRTPLEEHFSGETMTYHRLPSWDEGEAS